MCRGREVYPPRQVGGHVRSVEPDPQRAKLGFREAVLSSFKFLAELGLRLVDDNMTSVRYESPGVFINIYHGRASYEMNVEIGRLADAKKSLSIGSIVDWAGAYKTEKFGQRMKFQVSTREGVQELVPKLAALVREYAVALLRNEDRAWGAALDSQRRRWDDYVKAVNLASLRNKAEAAWQAKDYVRVVELYNRARQDLTRIEAKKLAYAEHQVATARGVGFDSSPSRKKH